MNSRGSPNSTEGGTRLQRGNELAEIARQLNDLFDDRAQQAQAAWEQDTTDRVSVAECVHVAYGIYWARRQRDRLLGANLFAEPAWDILLDLFVAGYEGRKVSVSSACVASAVPTSTALRHIAHLVELGLLVRTPHPVDARSSFLDLSEEGTSQMIDYLTLLSRVQDVHAG